jgi:hypothetical protein
MNGDGTIQNLFYEKWDGRQCHSIEEQCRAHVRLCRALWFENELLSFLCTRYSPLHSKAHFTVHFE